MTNTTSDDMKEMFGFSLCRTYELLLGQIQQARSNGALELKVCTAPSLSH